MVLPQIVMRDDYDQENNGNKTDLSYMFDKTHFVQYLGAMCPNMRIYETSEEVLHVKHLCGPILRKLLNLRAWDIQASHGILPCRDTSLRS